MRSADEQPASPPPSGAAWDTRHCRPLLQSLLDPHDSPWIPELGELQAAASPRTSERTSAAKGAGEKGDLFFLGIF
jgi:hypothetical protein